MKLIQNNTLPDTKIVDSSNHWIWVLPEKAKVDVWKRVPYAEEIQKRQKKRFPKNAGSSVLGLDLPNKRQSHLSLTQISKDIVAFKLLGLARELLQSHLDLNSEELSIAVAGFNAEQSERIVESLLAAALAANAELPSFKKEKKAKKVIKTLRIYGANRNDKYQRTFAEAEGNALARTLSVLPSNKLEPGHYLARVKKLAAEKKWKLDFYGVSELKKKKAGAFLAVAQGSPKADAGMLRLRYQGNKSNKKTLSLVGKGICYDTGGTNLKPAKYMFGMHEDMQGSAVALGTFLALSEMKVPFNMECWLALAMNHIGPKAYKPNDVITASDGTTIEIVHTDAEGRMVLADTLHFASKEKPDLIIDYATLTGACVYSLGTAYSGVFSNQGDAITDLIQAGKDSGERVWPFPLDEDYDEGIKSDIADVKQCSLDGEADHIMAARFLQRFVKNKVPWVHVDLSSSSRKGGLAHIPSDTTGFGIRFTLNLLQKKGFLGK